MKLKKISEFEWEIPKEGEMNVPVLILASDLLLDKMKEDKTFIQAQNMASLPGVLSNIIVCPDAHEGYGACIGGVAAYDLDKGVISPGEIGYDINCLSKDSKILTELGYYKEIKDFEEDYKRESLSIINTNKKELDNSSIAFFMKKGAEKILEITTKSGLKISTTREHPFLTKKGMEKIGELNKGCEILMFPFKGIKYEKPARKLLISEEAIDKLKRSQTSKLQIKKKLRGCGLLPLYSDNPKIPYLLKIMGFIFGDGNLSIKKTDQISFYGKGEDLELIKKDLEKIGFKSYFFTRKRHHKLESNYGKYEFDFKEESLRNNSRSLAILLKLLGVPEGNKSKKDYDLPIWIMNSVKWYKRLFLASLFGAEMSSPKTITGHKFNLNGLVFSLNKKNSLHGITFVNQISSILDEFGIRNVLIKNREDELNGKKSNRIRLMIYSNSSNLIKFFETINYEYNQKKRGLANAAILWLKQKGDIIDYRMSIMEKAREMKVEGFTKKEIIGKLSSIYANKYIIDKAIYCKDYGITGSRIAFCFISFNEFVKRNCYGGGFVWDEIEKIEEKEHKGFVYDFTINDKNHNFIAGGFVVSNCSVRLLKTNLTKKDIIGKQEKVVEAIYRKVPSGVGRGSKFNITKQELDKVLEQGAKYMVDKGYGVKEDYLHMEEEGCIKGADASKVSERAIKRGIGQLGTLGAGNHFLEVQYVDEIYDEEIAKVFGLEKDQVTIMVHCGSRGLGHQVASDYIKAMEDKYGFKDLPDRELINAPIKSQLGKDYFSAMACAANFAFANKQLITHWIREEMKYLFPKIKIEVIYDVCHNIAKFEKHVIDGKMKEICLHRKGATRAFGPNREELPEKYKKIGQPVIIPGSMGTASYLLVGTKKAEELTFASTAHGAGRVSSRSSALRNLRGENIKSQLKEKGIEVKSGSWKSLAEEAPEVYKDIDEVIRVVDSAGISKKIARLKPLAVVKG